MPRLIINAEKNPREMRGDDTPDISIILPTYNEVKNIGEVLDRTAKVLGPQGEIIVVDDDSPDGTACVVEKISTCQEDVRLIRRSGNRGLTASLQVGIDAARGDFIGWMDSDLSMPPELIPSLVNTVRQGADIAVGSRYCPGGSDGRTDRLAVALSVVICRLCQFFLDNRFRDYTSGFFLARRAVLTEIRLRGDYGEYFIDLIDRALRRGYVVREVPYRLVSRTYGTSKTAPTPLGFVNRGGKYLLMIAHRWLQI